MEVKNMLPDNGHRNSLPYQSLQNFTFHPTGMCQVTRCVSLINLCFTDRILRRKKHEDPGVLQDFREGAPTPTKWVS